MSLIDIKTKRVLSSTYKVNGTCVCGGPLMEGVNQTLGHVDNTRMCLSPAAVDTWIVLLDTHLAQPGETKADHMTIEELAAYGEMPFSGGPCSGCGQVLDTEQDFAAHFVIKDRRYLNLGDCPNNPKGA